MEPRPSDWCIERYDQPVPDDERTAESIDNIERDQDDLHSQFDVAYQCSPGDTSSVPTVDILCRRKPVNRPARVPSSTNRFAHGTGVPSTNTPTGWMHIPKSSRSDRRGERTRGTTTPDMYRGRRTARNRHDRRPDRTPRRRTTAACLGHSVTAATLLTLIALKDGAIHYRRTADDERPDTEMHGRPIATRRREPAANRALRRGTLRYRCGSCRSVNGPDSRPRSYPRRSGPCCY